MRWAQNTHIPCFRVHTAPLAICLNDCNHSFIVSGSSHEQMIFGFPPANARSFSTSIHRAGG